MKCSERTRDPWYPSKCQREAVEDGLCKLHLAAKRRREANEAKQAAAMDQSVAIRHEMEALAARAAAHGLHARPEYFHGWKRSLVIEADEMAALLDRLDQEAALVAARREPFEGGKLTR